MKLCMFHPVEHPMQRGWVGRIDGDHLVHLAAQTLQAFFTGGGAREHAVYPIDGVRLLAPVLHPPSVRLFEDERTFEFANPAAILGPGGVVTPAAGRNVARLELRPRLAAVIGADGEIGGFTALAEWRAPGLPPPKDRDFALGLGPAVLTPDELADAPRAEVRVSEDQARQGLVQGFDWHAARDFAAGGTKLYPGDILAAPALWVVGEIGPEVAVEVELQGIGTLDQGVGARS